MHAYYGIVPRPFRESDNDNWKYYEYVRIALTNHSLTLTLTYRVAQKVSHYQMIKNRTKSY